MLLMYNASGKHQALWVTFCIIHAIHIWKNLFKSTGYLFQGIGVIFCSRLENGERYFLNVIQDEPFQDCSQMGETKRLPPP